MLTGKRDSQDAAAVILPGWVRNYLILCVTMIRPSKKWVYFPAPRNIEGPNNA